MKHQQHAIHSNSAVAHNKASDTRSRRKTQILGVYQAAKQPLTDRQVMERLGFVDPNKVRPVITKLIDTRVLKEVGGTTCLVTGHRCRLVAPVSYKERQRKLF